MAEITTIRKATESDAEAITFVHVNSWKTSYQGIIDQSFLDNISFEERLDLRKKILKSQDSLHLVAVFEGKIIGFADAGPARSQEPFHQSSSQGEIYSLYLLEDHKGKGLGKELFNKCLCWLNQKGFKSLVVWVLAENSRARRFYENEGGEPIEETRFNHGDKDYKGYCYLFKISLASIDSPLNLLR